MVQSQNLYGPVLVHSNTWFADSQDSCAWGSYKPTHSQWSHLNLCLLIQRFNQCRIWTRGVSQEDDSVDQALGRETSFWRSYVRWCKYTIWEDEAAVYVCASFKFKTFAIVYVEFTICFLRTVQSYHLKKTKRLQTVTNQSQASLSTDYMLDHIVHQ